MQAIQLSLFEEDRIKILEEQIIHIQKTCDNVRRGLFVRHNELAKIIMKLQEDIQMLKGNIIRNPTIYDFFEDIKTG